LRRPDDSEFKPLDDIRCTLGEAPAYDDRRDALFWCDIAREGIHVHHFHDGRTQTFGSRAVSVRSASPSGRLVGAARRGPVDPESGVFGAPEIEAGNPTPAQRRRRPDGAFWWHDGRPQRVAEGPARLALLLMPRRAERSRTSEVERARLRPRRTMFTPIWGPGSAGISPGDWGDFRPPPDRGLDERPATAAPPT
jgi:hypothetical protein